MKTRWGVSACAILALAAWLVIGSPESALSVGGCSLYKTFALGHSVAHTDLNSLQTTLGQTNMVFSCLDDYSTSATEMKTTVNPWQNYAESLATTGQGEIERLRHMWKGLCNFTHWYSYTDNCSFVESGRSLLFHMQTLTTSHLALGIYATWNSATINFRTLDIDIYPTLKNDASHAISVSFIGVHTFAVSHAMVWAHGLTITSGHNSDSHSYQHTISPQRVAQSRGDTITLANGADQSLGASLLGMLFVSESASDRGSCLFLLNGAGNVVSTHIGGATMACSNDSGKASSTNVFYDSGKSVYQIQNNRGGSRTFRLLFLGGP